jgi:hypothetical protein
MRYEVVYNSDVVLSGNADLATYCIFYDRVLLPHTSQATVENMLEFARPRGSNHAPTLSAFEINGLMYRHGEVDRRTGEDIVEWENQNRVLFQEGVLSRLPPSGERIDWECGAPLTPTLDRLIHMTNSAMTSQGGETEYLYYRQDVVSHLLRADISQPQIFVSKTAQPVREILKACEAESVFRYLLPRLALAQPDQILEVRRKVKDTREGFSMHLQKLSEGIESKLKGGESLDDIRLFAQSVIETKLIPDYLEYVRQIRAEKAGFWGKMLTPVSEILQIDAAPWTPKFYGSLMKALGLTFLTPEAEKKQRMTNASQAYQFMHSAERSLRQLSRSRA